MSNVINLPTNTSVTPSPERVFLSKLQQNLEKKTTILFLQRNLPSTPIQTLEPEDLISVNQQEATWYNEVLKEVSNIRKTSSKDGLALALEMVPRDIEQEEKSNTAMHIYNQNLSYVLAERIPITNEVSREKQAALIYKRIIQEAPYLNASMMKLLEATLSAVSIKDVINSANSGIQKAIKQNNTSEENSDNIIVAPFGKQKYQNPVVEEEEIVDEVNLKIEKLRNMCRDFIDSGNYKDILIQPFSKNSISVRRLQKDTSFTKLCSALENEVQAYQTACQKILQIPEISFLTILSTILSIKHLCKIIDSYERTKEYMSLSFLADTILEEFIDIYSHRNNEKVDTIGLEIIGTNICNVSSILENLQKK